MDSTLMEKQKIIYDAVKFITGLILFFVMMNQYVSSQVVDAVNLEKRMTRIEVLLQTLLDSQNK